MPDYKSIPRRIASLKKLARTYYCLLGGALIEKFEEPLRIFDVRGSRHNNRHPHRAARVYITRRALKHFVEERRFELRKRHSDDEAIERICVAIEYLPDVIIDFDRYEYEPDIGHIGRHFYTKDHTDERIPSLRVLVESDSGDKKLYIVSVHFTKHRKTKNTNV